MVYFIIKGLPCDKVIRFNNQEIRICHNPSELEMYIMNDKIKRENKPPNTEYLKVISEDVEEDILISGHYHLFIDEIVNGKSFICTSSVGLPFNGDSRV